MSSLVSIPNPERTVPSRNEPLGARQSNDIEHAQLPGELHHVAVEHDPLYEFSKRAMDITGALLMGTFLLLLLPFLALAIRLDSPGPIFYRQTRVGRGGRPFTLYKFRTMVSNAEEVLFSDPVMLGEYKRSWKLQHDRRVTQFGALLRKTSLDELPQLFNVLIGDMSLVGPRPVQVPEVHESYGDNASKLLSAAPGLTGLWQISGRSDVRTHDRVSLDLEYIDQRSFMLDLKILLLTLPTVLARTGAR